jgi:hypothetical protein
MMIFGFLTIIKSPQKFLIFYVDFFESLSGAFNELSILMAEPFRRSPPKIIRKLCINADVSDL